MTLRSRKWFTPLAVGLVLVGAGGGSQYGGAGIGAAAPASVEQDCAANGVFGRPSPTLSALATQVRTVHLPAYAVLVRATRCLYEERDVPGDGSWTVLIEQRADSGLGALATALRLPDGNRETCTLFPAYPLHIITVTDATGRVLHVVLPTDPCGAPLQKAVDAVDAVSWQTTGTVKVRQVR